MEDKELNVESYNIIYKNTDNKVAPKSTDNIYVNRKHMGETIASEDVLVSILVLAYNNLEGYTKRCIESILKYTKGISYELILVDNGSSDGTFEFFKEIKHSYKKIIKVSKNIGGGYGGYYGVTSCNSRYIAIIPNDVFVTENWLNNLLKCAMSDDQIGMVVPSSNNVSNWQEVKLDFQTVDEMFEKAAKNNISDNKKWEERLRIVTILTLLKKECFDIIGSYDYGFFHDFADDDLSFRVRRAGYKTILCKDTFVYHAQQNNTRDPKSAINSLEKGRSNFIEKYHGIDSWSDINYEVPLLSLLDVDIDFRNRCPKVLGIDVGCGGPILEVKNKLKSKGINDTRLYSFTTDPKYWLDLKTICGENVIIDRMEYFNNYFIDEKFDYIILSNPINSYKAYTDFFRDIVGRLKDSGQILVKLKNTYSAVDILKILGYSLNTEKVNYSQISLNEFNEIITSNNCVVDNSIGDLFNLDKNLEDIFKNLYMYFLNEVDLKKSMVNSYSLSVRKNLKN